MKILIVSQYYYPEQFQINEIAPELAKRGHEVTVLTGMPNYPKGEIFEGYEDAYKKEEIVNGIRVIRCNCRPRKKGTLNLILNYLSFYVKGVSKAKKLKGEFDLVLSYQLSPITSVAPAAYYAKRHNLPHLLYCLDIWPESAQAQIKNKNSLPFKLISNISRKLYRSADIIAVTSRPFVDYLGRVHAISKDKMVYIPQHADDSYLSMDLSNSENDGKVHFMYAGNMGKGQTLEVIANAVAEISDRDDFVVDIVGDGSRKEALCELIKELDLEDKFVFHGNQKREDMPAFYKKADALLLTLRGNNEVGNTMPGKLQVYMTTKKPILAAINGAASEVIYEANCGRSVKAGDSKGLAELMADFIDNKEIYSACGENAAAYFRKHFTLKEYTDRLEKQINLLVNKNEF